MSIKLCCILLEVEGGSCILNIPLLTEQLIKNYHQKPCNEEDTLDIKSSPLRYIHKE